MTKLISFPMGLVLCLVTLIVMPDVFLSGIEECNISLSGYGHWSNAQVFHQLHTAQPQKELAESQCSVIELL